MARIKGLTAISQPEGEQLQNADLKSNFAALFVRHHPPWALSGLDDPLPTICQHENPLAWSTRLSMSRHYLTDRSYIPFFDSAEEQFTPPISLTDRNPSQKEFDVLFIGTPRSVSPTARLMARPYVNSFRGMGDIAIEWENRLGLDRSARLLEIWRNASGGYQRRILDAIRGERRSEIVRNLVSVSRDDIRVAVIGYAPLRRLSELGNIEYLGDRLPWPSVEVAIRMSRLTVCTTPNHSSMLNERLIACIEMDSLPLIEPFPQNQAALGDVAETLTFDYRSRSLGRCIGNNLEAYEEVSTRFQAQRNALAIVHSASAVQAKLASAVAHAQEVSR